MSSVISRLLSKSIRLSQVPRVTGALVSSALSGGKLLLNPETPDHRYYSKSKPSHPNKPEKLYQDLRPVYPKKFVKKEKKVIHPPPPPKKNPVLIQLPIFNNDQELIEYMRAEIPKSEDLPVFFTLIRENIRLDIFKKILEMVPRRLFTIYFLNRVLEFYYLYHPFEINEAMELFSEQNIEYNVSTFTILLEYHMKYMSSEDTNDFIQQMLDTKVFLEGKILNLLVEFYTQEGNYIKAIQFLKKRETNDASKTVQLINLVLLLINNKEFDRAYDLFTDEAPKYPIAKQGFQLLRILKAFNDHQQLDYDKLIIDYLERNKMITISMLNQLILYYVETGNFTTANLLQQKIFDLSLEPTIATFLPFIRHALKERNLSQAKNYLFLMEEHHVEVNDMLYYHLLNFTVQDNIEQHEISQHLQKKLLARLLSETNINTFVSVLLAAEKENNQRLISLILRATVANSMNRTRFNFLAIFSNEMIKNYLIMNEFQNAMRWYETRASVYSILPNAQTIECFVTYHNRRQEHALKSFWENKFIELSIRREPDLTHYTERDFEVKKPQNAIDQILNYMNFDLSVLLAQDSKANANKVQKSDAVVQQQTLKVSYSPEEIMLNSLIKTYHKSESEKAETVARLKSVITKLLTTKYIPSTDILQNAMTIIYKHYSNQFLPWCLSIPDRPMRFINIYQNILLENDINLGVASLNRDIFMLQSVHSFEVWASILSGILRSGDLDLAVKIIRQLREKNRTIPVSVYSQFGCALLERVYQNHSLYKPHYIPIQEVKESPKENSDDFLLLDETEIRKGELFTMIKITREFYQDMAKENLTNQEYLRLPLLNSIIRIALLFSAEIDEQELNDITNIVKSETFYDRETLLLAIEYLQSQNTPNAEILTLINSKSCDHLHLNALLKKEILNKSRTSEKFLKDFLIPQVKNDYLTQVTRESKKPIQPETLDFILSSLEFI